MPCLGDAELAKYFSCEKTLFTIDDDINGNADQYFGQNIKKFIENGIERRQLKIASVIIGVAQQPL